MKRYVWAVAAVVLTFLGLIVAYSLMPADGVVAGQAPAEKSR